MTSAATIARRIFDRTLRDLDVGRLVRARVRVGDSALRIGARALELDRRTRVEVVAIGKAAAPMARALGEILSGGPPCGGVVVTNEERPEVPPGFEWFRGGHPLPDERSLVAGRAVIERVTAANREDALVVFAISGGASALCEWPIDDSIGLEHLRVLNRELVTCGARIGEINAVRRAVSAIKGGRLAAAAPRARQVSLLVSDVNPGDLASLGSGPTVPPPAGEDAAAIVDRLGIGDRLPAPVVACIRAPRPRPAPPENAWLEVLADNDHAVEVAVAIAAEEIGAPVVGFGLDPEASVEEVAARLAEAIRAADALACIVSGGEAVCPVRGDGCGGRSLETALRVAMMLDGDGRDVAVLCAGTDGVDGNSPAAGAVADPTTVARAIALGLDPHDHLARSDSYPLFAALGDDVTTGPTGNNLRDLRIAVVA